jgi:hypothetical protein
LKPILELKRPTGINTHTFIDAHSYPPTRDCLIRRVKFQNCIEHSKYTPSTPSGPLAASVRRKNLDALSTCFGSEFRSPTLGLRHIDKSIYVDQLDRWFQNFRRDQFLILRYEWVIKNPVLGYKRMLEFLGQNTFGQGAFRDESELSFLSDNLLSTSNSHKEAISDALKQEINCFFSPHNGRLNTMLGENILPTYSNCPPVP